MLFPLLPRCVRARVRDGRTHLLQQVPPAAGVMQVLVFQNRRHLKPNSIIQLKNIALSTYFFRKSVRNE